MVTNGDAKVPPNYHDPRTVAFGKASAERGNTSEGKIRVKHTGEKPYRCEVCTIGFTQQSNMKLHMKRSHGYGASGDKPMGGTGPSGQPGLRFLPGAGTKPGTKPGPGAGTKPGPGAGTKPGLGGQSEDETDSLDDVINRAQTEVRLKKASGTKKVIRGAAMHGRRSQSKLTECFEHTIL
ncbi:hypothetical protein E1301_Tti020419 [Triplophysa tibetana]|uniref:C2H2-type domain-containing protein n=1 Tax=Triplophysa tibetana TaxID=1572043 RepID=A0A5A9NAL2_9TELE|nr:hypothetical protein E1301_Tti020419 [Triplophysa tibetana]